MYKYALPILLLGAVYFFFFHKNYPETVHFQGTEFHYEENNNDSLDKDFDVFSYRDISKNQVLIIGKSGDSGIPAEVLLEHYAAMLESQGVELRQDGDTYIGQKASQAVYLTKTALFDGYAGYVDARPGQKAPNSFDIITELQNLSIE